jgi:hypothetical protein
MTVRGRWSRRRTGLVVGLTASAVLAGGLVAADRVVASRAAGRLAARLACVTGTPAAPRVRIAGFPFVRQALAGRLDRVEVDADRVVRGDVTVDRVRAVLSGARLPDGGGGAGSGGGPVRIDAAEIGFDVPFDRLPARLRDRPVSYRSAPGGLLAVSTELTTPLGQVPATLLVRPALAGARLTLEPVEVDVLGVRRPADRLGERLGERLGDLTNLSRDLPELPLGLGYHSVGVGSGGLRLTVAGRSLSVDTGGGRGDGRGGCRSDQPAAAATGTAVAR